MNPIGDCVLCLHGGVELQHSHYLPAAIYRLCRTADTHGNPSPLFVARGIAVQTDYQERAYLLCRNCEQRFNKFGERWVFANGVQPEMSTFGPFTVDEKTFPLLAQLEKLKPSQFGFGVRVFTDDQVDAPAREALAYFAASMFWRGSVYAWGRTGVCPVKLGRYKEAFRQYLNGESDFPVNAALTVTVREPGMIWKHTHQPVSARTDGTNVHKFAMPGFVFHMWVGQNLADWVTDGCFVRGTGRPLMVGGHLEQGIGDTASGVLHADDETGAKKLQAIMKRQTKTRS